MATNISAKTIIEHLLDGTFETTLCRICLKPLGEVCENIFTQFWFEKCILSVADILKIVCQAEFSEKENCNVCSDCIVEAFTVYNFYLKFKNTTKLLEDYVNDISECMGSVDRVTVESDSQIFLQLNTYKKDKVDLQEYDVQNFLGKSFEMCLEEFDKKKPSFNYNFKLEYDFDDFAVGDNDDQSELVSRKNVRRKKIDSNNVKKKKIPSKQTKPKQPKKPTRCTLCHNNFTKFRRLLYHMKSKHDLNYCEICLDFYRNTEKDFESHMKMHINAYCCDMCQTIVKDEEAMVEHMESHKANFVCYKCGLVFKDEIGLKYHMRKHNTKQYICMYCGIAHKKADLLKKHLVKHEVALENKNISTAKELWKVLAEKGEKKSKERRICSECGADFVDNRALNMHVMRAHTGETPFKCEECGRGFVSKNLCNEHIARAHRPPPHRCPFCPNAFPSISYVNVHIRKVHLRTDKRYARPFPQDVTWPTTTVPFEKLKVPIQHRILDMVKSGQLVLPEEMVTDKVRRMLEVKSEMEI